jgi:hypothetical protein
VCYGASLNVARLFVDCVCLCTSLYVRVLLFSLSVCVCVVCVKTIKILKQINRSMRLDSLRPCLQTAK